MSETLESLRRKLEGAAELGSVVRTMKALAASSIGQYERAAAALEDYYRTVRLGLAACLRQGGPVAALGPEESAVDGTVGAVVFGSDLGLVGQFNEYLADFVQAALAAMPGEKRLWAVGERIHSRLADLGLAPEGLFAVPNSVGAITPLVGSILVETEERRSRGELQRIYLFHNRPSGGALPAPASQRLMPLDRLWQRELTAQRWPTGNLPEPMFGAAAAMPALVREFLFVSLFRACAESLASENAARLAAMQRAEKNIGELREQLGLAFHRMRQSGIDEELFDVVSGYESLSKDGGK